MYVIYTLHHIISLLIFINLPETTDFEAIHQSIYGDNSEVTLRTNDDMTVEHNENILLKYQHQIPLYTSFVTREGEFFRETAIVNIIDNDGKNIASLILCYSVGLRIMEHVCLPSFSGCS